MIMIFDRKKAAVPLYTVTNRRVRQATALRSKRMQLHSNELNTN